MTKNISILTPTRERPDKALRMLQSAVISSSQQDLLKVMFYIDQDDKMLQQYYNDLKLGPFGGNVEIIVGERQPLGKCWNKMAMEDSKINNDGILMMGNDDIVFKIYGWDNNVRQWDNRFTDNIYVLYPDDSTGQGKCTFPIVSRKFVDILGYFAPEMFEFLCHDTYLEMIGRKIGRLTRMNDVVIEHLHFAFGKSKYDETYAYWRKNGATQRDVQLLSKLYDVIDAEADKLKQQMNNEDIRSI